MILSRGVRSSLFAIVISLVTASAPAQDFPQLAGTHPVLVTVDDLPIGSGALHTDPAERERITRGLLDVLAKH